MADVNSVVEQTALLLLFVLSTAANSLALCVYTKRPGLRTISNRFVMNLLGTNLVTTTLLASTLIGEHSAASALQHYWTAASDTAAATCSLAALLGVLLISIDQHHAVTDPLRCHAKIMQRKPNLLVGAAWTAAIVAGAARACLAAWRIIDGKPNSMAVDCEAAFAGAYLAAGVFAPSVAVCIMYVRIYSAARSSGLRARAHNASSLQLQDPQPPLPDLVEEEEGLTLKIDESKPEQDVEKGSAGTYLAPPSERPRRCPSVASLRQSKKEAKSNEDVRGLTTASSAPILAGMPLLSNSRPTSGSRITSFKCRISNASLFRYREESRAARIGVLTVVLVALHAPHAVVSLLRVAGVDMKAARAPSLALLVLAAALSPFLFALRSRHVQREARRILLPQKSHIGKGTLSVPNDNQTRAALELLKTLQQRESCAGGAARDSFSSGGSTQVSTASDD